MTKIATYTADDQNGRQVTDRAIAVFGAMARKMVVEQAEIASATRGNIWVTARDEKGAALHTFGLASGGRFLRQRIEF